MIGRKLVASAHYGTVEIIIDARATMAFLVLILASSFYFAIFKPSLMAIEWELDAFLFSLKSTERTNRFE